VTLPLGRLMLATRPISTGSAAVEKMIGIVMLPVFAARAEGPPPATITATLRLTRSAPVPAIDRNDPRPSGTRPALAALDIAGLAQAPPEGGDRTGILGGRCTVEESDHRHSRLLRVRRQRPCRRAAESGDEFAPSKPKPHLPLPSPMGARYRDRISRQSLRSQEPEPAPDPRPAGEEAGCRSLKLPARRPYRPAPRPHKNSFLFSPSKLCPDRIQKPLWHDCASVHNGHQPASEREGHHVHTGCPEGCQGVRAGPRDRPSARLSRRAPSPQPQRRGGRSPR
jgi:hypothetical protein